MVSYNEKYRKNEFKKIKFLIDNLYKEDNYSFQLMNKNYIPKIIYIIFLLTLIIRLYIAFQTPHFSDDEAYFTLRQIESIKETGTPLFQDELSYGGRTYFFLPVFHYILAFFSLFFSTVAIAKIIPNIFASSLIIIIYLIVFHLTKDKKVSTLTAFISSSIPIYISETINSVSVYSLSIPLTFLLLYFFLKIRAKKFLYLFLITISIFLVSSAYLLIFILSMLLFILFSWVEGFKPTKTEIEITIFSLFLSIWFYFIFYQDALLMHGYKIIWQNIPNEVITQYFSNINIISSIYEIGVIPLITGLFVIYHYVFNKKKKSIYFILSMGIIITILLLQKYIILNIGLVYMGILLSILLGEFLIIVISYIKQTKFSKFRNYFLLIFLLLFLFTSFFPAITYAKNKVMESDPAKKVSALKFLESISNEDDLVVGSIYDGHLITYSSNRKNLIDQNFLLIDATQRLRDLRTLYTSAIETKPIEIMKKYNANHILITKEALEYYNITKISYVDNECFPLTYAGKEVKIYSLKC